MNKFLRKYNILLSLLLFFIALGIILAYILYTPPSQGYEPSLYTVYPSIFWIAFVIAITVGICIILFKRPNGLLLFYIITLLIITRTMLNIIPYIRGYFVNDRSDVLLHLGSTKDIIHSGVIPPFDFYPNLHILLAVLREVCNCEPNLIVELFPAYSFIVFILGYYLFISNIFKRDAPVFFILAITMPIGTLFVNREISLSILAMGLAIFVSQRIPLKSKYLLLTIFISTLIYFHPLTSMYAVGVLLLIGIIDRFVHELHMDKDKILKHLVAISVILWMTWYFSFYQIQRNLRLLFTSKINPYLSGSIKVVKMYSIPLNDLLRMIFYRYGETSIFMIIFIITTMIVFKKISKESLHKNDRRIIYFISTVSMFLAIGIATLMLRFVNYERIFKYIILFSIPLGGYVIIRNTKNAITNMISIITMFIITYLMVFSVYSSPIIGLENPQITRSEYAGWSWLFDTGSDNISILTGQPAEIKWFYSLIYGISKAINNPRIYTQKALPPHFGYPTTLFAGDMLSQERYFFTNKFMVSFYPMVLPDKPDAWKWTEMDYMRIKTDPTSDFIYSSQDCWVYLVHPTKR